MIFIFDKPCQNTFTMKNTYFPLKLIFLDDNLRVVDQKTGIPFSSEKIKPKSHYQYVIEIQ
jgi:uncharacterized membrane protein (UPF0127 family)